MIIACHPRAVRWLIQGAGVNPEQHQVAFINLRNPTTETIKDACFEFAAEIEQREPIRIKSTGDWVPWFPVIDYDRCTHCKQCLNFCLFKVFDLDQNEKMFVKNPANCKNNCPACARICPEIAIMFPKLDESPINGDVVSESEINKNLKIDMNAIMDGNLYDALKQRNARNRTRLLRRKQIEKALAERKKCGCENNGPFKLDPRA